MLSLAFAALVVPASAVQSAEIEGVRFPEQLQMGEAQLQLRGTGLLRYRRVFKAYVAALYLDERAQADEVLGEVPRRIEIEYFWSIPAERFAQATVDGIARNVDAETFESLQAQIGSFNALYRDIEPGDRFALTYLPGRGTELAHNGTARGVVAGADFAAALFAIWLGENPLDEGLRRKLLAQQ
jgi:Chalcone isomerase-like